MSPVDRTHHGPFSGTPDTATRHVIWNDANVDIPVSTRPWGHAQGLGQLALRRFCYHVTFSANQNAPTLAQGLVDVVHFKGNLPLSERLHERGRRGRSENDVAIEHPEIHRERDGPSGFVEHHPAHAAGADESSAGLRIEGAECWACERGRPPWRLQDATAGDGFRSSSPGQPPAAGAPTGRAGGTHSVPASPDRKGSFLPESRPFRGSIRAHTGAQQSGVRDLRRCSSLPSNGHISSVTRASRGHQGHLTSFAPRGCGSAGSSLLVIPIGRVSRDEGGRDLRPYRPLPAARMLD